MQTTYIHSIILCSEVLNNVVTTTHRRTVSESLVLYIISDWFKVVKLTFTNISLNFIEMNLNKRNKHMYQGCPRSVRTLFITQSFFELETKITFYS